MSALVRKQVYLTAAQQVRLRRVAALRKCAEAEVIRAALDAHLGIGQAAQASPEKDPIWRIVGVGESRSGDLSLRADDYLYGSRAAK